PRKAELAYWTGEIGPMYNQPNSIVAWRSNQKYHYGNPFVTPDVKSKYTNVVVVSDTFTASALFFNWLVNPNSKVKDQLVGAFQEQYTGPETFGEIQPERREWIVNMIKSGRLDGIRVLYPYVKERLLNNHAIALTNIINNRKELFPLILQPKSAEPLKIHTFKFQRANRIGGTLADAAMRERADAFVGEVSTKESSTYTSARVIAEKIEDSVNTNSETGTTISGKSDPSVVMLARNSEFKGQPLSEETIKVLDRLKQKEGIIFIVGDMEGVDTPFIEYLKENLLPFEIYGHGRYKASTKEEVIDDPTFVQNKTRRLLILQ